MSGARRELALSALAALGAIACSGEATEPRPRNLLLVTVDTLRADALGCYGYERDTSPRIDEFARDALVFEDVQATSSWTLPSMASLMTGLYTTAHGCWDLDTPLDGSVVTLAERLSDAGFATSGFVSQVFVAERFGMHQGFQRFDDELSELGRAHNMFTSTAADLTTRAVRALPDAPREEPWAVWVHYYDPHAAYVPHPGLSEQFGDTERDLYDGEIAWVDRHFGMLLDALEERGLADDTLVVLVSDHGEEFGEHGGRYHRRTLFVESIRVPLIMRVPGEAPARVRSPLGLVDVAPTIVAMLGLAPFAAVDGEAWVGEETDRSVLLELENDGERTLGLYDGQRRLIRAPDGTLALYDCLADPRELVDRAADRAADAERCAEQLEALRGASADRAVHPGERVELTPEERELLRASGTQATSARRADASARLGHGRRGRARRDDDGVQRRGARARAARSRR